MLTILAIPFDNSSTDLKGHNVGDERFDQTTGKWFRLQALHTVLNSDTTVAGTVALMAGSGVVCNTKAASIDTTNVVAVGVFNGTCAESASTSAYNYAWVQIGGLATVNKDSNAIAVGDCVVADAATDGAVTALADATAVTGLLLKAAMGVAPAAALAGDATVSIQLRWLR